MGVPNTYLGIGNITESKAKLLQIKAVGEKLLQTCMDYKCESRTILNKGEARWAAPPAIHDALNAPGQTQMRIMRMHQIGPKHMIYFCTGSARQISNLTVPRSERDALW